jgi:hypothetical protein
MKAPMSAQERVALDTRLAERKAELRRLEAALREDDRLALEQRLLAAGRLVEACGLLDVETGVLEQLLKRVAEHFAR